MRPKSAFFFDPKSDPALPEFYYPDTMTTPFLAFAIAL
jgi:hypothetical protein